MSSPDLNNSLDTLYEISNILNTGLDKSTLSILISLCENNVNPEALAEVILELRRELNSVENQNTNTSSELSHK